MNLKEKNTMNMKKIITQALGKEIAEASNEEIYDALLTVVEEMAEKKERTDGKKKLYYISAEFLIGKLLSNNMINLGIYKEVKEVLEVIKELAHTGITMTLVTHEMGFAREVADRICFIDDGLILEDAPPDEFFSNPKTDRAKSFLEKVL